MTIVRTVNTQPPLFESTENQGSIDPCRLCAPLGAALVFKGTEKAVTLLHGSQGCATYIRRYCISHFREPIDIASSSFSEDSVVFGGKQNLLDAIRNVCTLYAPDIIGIATTCLAETIGDDPALHLASIPSDTDPPLPHLITVSTPSYRGCHTDGYRAAVNAILRTFAEPKKKANPPFVVVPGLLSPSDLRYLHELAALFGIPHTILADYSETLDGGNWDTYHSLPPGGTPLDAIKTAGCAIFLFDWIGGGTFLTNHFKVPTARTPPPIGIDATDQFIAQIEHISGTSAPITLVQERARLVDAYVDGHKYVSGIRVLIHGEAPLCAAMAGFCSEIGCIPIVVSSPEPVEQLQEWLSPDISRTAVLSADKDYDALAAIARETRPSLIIGNSKCAGIARTLKVPLVRIGFPIHDRFGAARLLHIGYRGTLCLFDRIVNALIETKQNGNDIGYAYI